MKGYVARKSDRWYAVIYEGLDPVTGKERRSWHPAGTSRADAERLAASLAAEMNGWDDGGRSLTLGAYLAARWLPGKKLELAHSTWDGYRRKVVGLPYTFNVRVLFDLETGEVTNVFASGVISRVPLAGGDLFLTAGRLDFAAHGSSFLVQPDVGAQGNVEGFCEALSP